MLLQTRSRHMCVYLPKDDHVYELEKGISNLVIYETTQNPRPLKSRFKTQFQQHPPAVHSCTSLRNLRSRKNIQQKVASQIRRHNISRYINSHDSNCAGTQRQLENYQPKHKYCTLRATIAATAEKKTSEQWVSYSFHDKLVATFLLLPQKQAAEVPCSLCALQIETVSEASPVCSRFNDRWKP